MGSLGFLEALESLVSLEFLDFLESLDTPISLDFLESSLRAAVAEAAGTALGLLQHLHGFHI